MADADPTDLSPQQALIEVGRALRFEASLRSRTEGLTWMTWGLVSAGTFLTFEAVTALYYGGSPFATADYDAQRAPWWTGGLWVPWLVVGMLTTYALWQNAALSFRRAETQRPRHLLVLLAWIAAVAAGWSIAVVALPDANEATFPVIGIGTAWMLLAATDLYRGTRRGRAVAAIVGGCIVVAGVAMAATMSPHAGADRSGAVVGHVAAVVTGLVPFIGGLWQALRG